jgi:hypothetical protein
MDVRIHNTAATVLPHQRHCEGILVLTPAFGLYFGTPVLSEEVFGALIVLHPRASSSWDYD